MDAEFKTTLWQQFGAAIDMFEDAINLCPDHLWSTVLWKDTEDARYGQFWFIAYHTVFWLDLYLSDATYKSFLPPPPFVRGKLPDEPYTKVQILTYLAQSRAKCQTTIEALTDDKAREPRTYNWIEASFLEMLLYTMRHVQEHAGQLSLVLGQHDVSGMDWVTQARNKTP
ncbi:MAG: DinB family protein [Anaerolineae bacterium]